MSTKSTSRKFVCYYRVSTAQQGRSGLEIEAQRQMVSRFLAEQAGSSTIAEFVEEESGKRNDRIKLAEALAACRLYKATLVIAKLDRLARNAQFLVALVDGSVDVQFGDMTHIPPGAAGRLMLQMMAAVAEFEAGVISERTKAALQARVAKKGQWDRKAAHHLQPGAGQRAATAAIKTAADARAVDLVGHIKGLQAGGLKSLNSVALRLNADGVATARGGAWTATAVRRVLSRGQAQATEEGAA